VAVGWYADERRHVHDDRLARFYLELDRRIPGKCGDGGTMKIDSGQQRRS
jgi:hypothetical protein